MAPALFIFLPVLLMTIWLIIVSAKRHDWSSILLFPLLNAVIIFQFVLLASQWEIGSSDAGIFPFSEWISCSIPVLSYIFICTRCRKKWYMTSTFVLIAMTLINLSSGMTVYIGEGTVMPPPADSRIHIVLNGDCLIRLKLWQLSILLQSVWIYVRCSMYYRKVRKKHLHFSRETKNLLYCLSATGGVGFLSVLVPDSIWYASRIPMVITLTLVSVGMCIILHMLINGAALTPFLDINENPEVFTSYDDREGIWDKIRETIEKDKLFLNSSISLDEVARLVGTNRTYVTSAISRNTDTNFTGYINSLRIAEATRVMVEFPEKKLEEVAELCGFSSASSFTKVYKRGTGMTPKEGKKKGLKQK